MPTLREGNGSIPLSELEKIVGRLPPEVERFIPYLNAVIKFRKEWSETGANDPPIEAGEVLEKLGCGTSLKKIRGKIGRQLDLICRAYPVPGVSGVKPTVTTVNPNVLVVSGEITPDEAWGNRDRFTR